MKNLYRHLFVFTVSLVMFLLPLLVTAETNLDGTLREETEPHMLIACVDEYETTPELYKINMNYSIQDIIDIIGEKKLIECWIVA